MKIKAKPPRWMKPVVSFRSRMSGAKGDEIVEGHLLAKEAWGESCDDEDSGLTAFAYLWRRFGPPGLGSDDHKALVQYVLGTPEKDVFLTLNLSASPLCYAVGYIANRAVRDKVGKPARDWEKSFQDWYLGRGGVATSDAYWEARTDRKTMKLAVKELGKFPLEPLQRKRGDWKKASEEVRRVNRALLASMAELLRPVFIRDVPINIFGTSNLDASAFEHEARPSALAGFGIQLDAIGPPKISPSSEAGEVAAS